MRIGYRHSDSRIPFLWQTSPQPPARWHGPGEGPANHFADTPVGAWAEFLRHEGIVDAADLAGVQRSLWAVELLAAGYTPVHLPHAALFGNESSNPACQAEAARLRAAGATRLEVRGVALRPGGAHGWTSDLAIMAGAPRDGLVWVIYGTFAATGWIAVEGGAPPARVLPLVRPL